MEEHALKGENTTVLRNGVLSYGDVPVLLSIGTNGWAMADRWPTVSFWGRPYRLNREEFDRCQREASASLLCTILDVRAK